MSSQFFTLNCKTKPEQSSTEEKSFDVLKIVGTGTFGKVVLCKEINENAFYAIKVLSIHHIVNKKQIEHVKSERNILLEISHPFIVSMRFFARDLKNIYLGFEFIDGGELFSYLRKIKKFDSPTANFYAREILLALEYLHSLSIIYRDLKPENLMLDHEGHLKITDFGFSKKLKDRTWTLCGTMEYLAPEIIQNRGHNKGVDFWAFGILIFEMLVGKPPFRGEDFYAVQDLILNRKIEWPKNFDLVAKDLIKKLLTVDRTKRLGCMRNGAKDIKSHRWFSEVNWTDVYNRKYDPPIKPKTGTLTTNFEDYGDNFGDDEEYELEDNDIFNDF
ncbi:hypothetical protein PVAND_015569 [Polypedilum vanderplanki]|uniref:cAMP-dependent protein kinase catalytic subunit n=1 Tax=Polypedilum vanderplanki TaxID=319348 RepID=A0A9J6BCK4_POLVA|nr:hypothetical protein PVAND_015569 [Polypedilum vanderplanki]